MGVATRSRSAVTVLRGVIAVVVGLSVAAACSAAEDEVAFGEDVLPILSEHCFTCHGPDEAARSTELRLDDRDSAFSDLGGYSAFVAGDPDASEAIRRVFSTDPDELMPPPEAKLELDDAARETLRRWVASGAEWQGHWAFEPPKSPDTETPLAEAVDTLVKQRLEQQGLRPSPPADPKTLLRRVSLVLTGLPPTPAEASAFAADPSPEAYAAHVERLLASDECAEWLALEWMDVSRYADSHGLHADGARTSWPWRDWVLGAFRDNMPYDEFVTWQIAGDLLDDATREQRLATAFLRNHPMTGEGGVIDEEFRWNYVFDRVETVGTALLGLTLQCCRCHDHKFDPVSQNEYYEVAAFFNNLRELGMTGDDGDFGPLLALPDGPTEAKVAALDRAIAALDATIDELPRSAPSDTTATEPIEPTRRLPLDGLAAVEGEDGDERVDGADFVTHRKPAEFVPGVVGQAARIDGDYGYLELTATGLTDVADPLSVALWVQPAAKADGAAAMTQCLVGNGGHKNQQWRGWEFYLDEAGRLAVSLTSGMPADRIVVRTMTSITTEQWTHVAFAYDGSGAARGVALFVDGVPAETVVVDEAALRSIYPMKNAAGYPPDHDRKLRVGRSHRNFTGDNGAYTGLLDELVVYDAALTAVEVAALYDAQRPANAVAAAPRLGAGDRERHALRRSAAYRALDRDRRALLAMRTELATATPQMMVARESAGLRETHVLDRGLYDRPGDVVAPDTPSAIGRMPENTRRDRRGFANWVFAAENPLSARVAANRYWQLVFGSGLVATPQDFGLQGARPSHPELLDLIATRFERSGWNLRRLLRGMVMSQTFRQSSDPAERSLAGGVDPLAIDPGNRLLWRGPSRRLQAEALRDAALAASGLLVKKVGGPSVKPYQPKGLWIEKSNFSHDLLTYEPGAGDALYRRSMYTFVRRTSPPPAMTVFDAPNRSVCTVKREATNTPLQPLVLMNDPQFVEAARVLAERVHTDETGDPEARVAELFRRLTGRAPDDAESESLAGLYADSLLKFEAAPEAAQGLLETGEHPRVAAADASNAELAALAIVANTLMNYDAFYMQR